LYENRVKQLYEQGKPSFGTFVVFPSPVAVEAMALAGLDFVVLDGYLASYNDETLESMIQAAYSHNVTPWVRVRNDPWAIMTTLDLGAQMITIPNVGSVAAARAAVSATFYPPKGDREMSRPMRMNMRNLTMPDYIDWAHNNVVLAGQIEGRDGIENYKDIVKVEGLDVIQTGRGDISLALGVPGQDLHPKVLEIEERIATAALEAGKQVSLKEPLTELGLERTLRWIEQGVLTMIIDSEYAVMLRDYHSVLDRFQSVS
jgi:4-hydroxy-2-oxoheptanedioate aldolase